MLVPQLSSKMNSVPVKLWTSSVVHSSAVGRSASRSGNRWLGGISSSGGVDSSSIASSDSIGPDAAAAGLSLMTSTPTVVQPAVAMITAMIARAGQKPGPPRTTRGDSPPAPLPSPAGIGRLAPAPAPPSTARPWWPCVEQSATSGVMAPGERPRLAGPWPGSRLGRWPPSDRASPGRRPGGTGARTTRSRRGTADRRAAMPRGGDRGDERGSALRDPSPGRGLASGPASGRGRAPPASRSIRSRKPGMSSSGCPTPQSPQSRRTRFEPSPRTLPGWQSPWTRPSPRPQAAIRSNRDGSPSTKSASVTRSAAATRWPARSTRSAMAAVSAGARQSGSPIASSSSARPSHATWIPTRMSTIGCNRGSGASY